MAAESCDVRPSGINREWISSIEPMRGGCLPPERDALSWIGVQRPASLAAAPANLSRPTIDRRGRQVEAA